MVLPKIERIGEVNFNTYGHKMKVISYKSEKDIEVLFEDGYIKRCSYGRFKSGNVKNNFMPSKYGVAYIGNTDTKDGGIEKTSYRTWVGILDRVFDGKLKSYDNVCISKEWLSYENFEIWYNKNMYNIENEKMCIDKDILSNENKIYSEDTCIIIPERINNILINFYNKESGITYRNRVEKYEVSCRDFDGKKKYLGYYEDKDEAISIYRRFKINTIIEVLNSYKDKLPKNVYNLIINKFKI